MGKQFCFGSVMRFGSLLFILNSFLFGQLSYAMDREAGGDSKAIAASIFSPQRTASAPVFFISPASQSLSFVIYLIHDAPIPLTFSKVDFENEVVVGDDFKAKVAELDALIDSLAKDGRIESFHRYIGYVSQVRRSDRTATHRFLEHVKACNSTKKQSERRLYQGLRKNAKSGTLTYLTVLAHDIDPSQIKAVEAYFIDRFQALGDRGWNSCSGDVDGMRALCATSTAASAEDEDDDAVFDTLIGEGEEERSPAVGALTFK
jgi:hypothetical protein